MSRFKLLVVAHVFLLRTRWRYFEPGETLVQAAVWECREEVGVTLESGALRVIGVTSYVSPTRTASTFF